MLRSRTRRKRCVSRERRLEVRRFSAACAGATIAVCGGFSTQPRVLLKGSSGLVGASTIAGCASTGTAISRATPRHAMGLIIERLFSFLGVDRTEAADFSFDLDHPEQAVRSSLAIRDRLEPIIVASAVA